MPQDYYKTLGVERRATSSEIRKAYKKLVREYHPDVRPDDKVAENKFKEIQEAYAVLSDSTKREQYDRFGHAFQDAGGNPFAGGGAGGFDLDDLLGGMFGGGGGRAGRGGFGGFGGQAGPRQRRAQPAKGQDLTAEIAIPFQLAIDGGQYELTINRGNEVERLNISIPPGVDTGSKIRLAGQGHAGQHGGPPGNLLVKVTVSAHPWFRREGKNVYVDVPLTPAEAVLGCRVDVPTLKEGIIVLTIPPGTSSGAKLRLREKGIADRKSGKRGDQFVVIKVEVPKEIDDETRDLYEQLRERDDCSLRDELWDV